jgi:DNA invertase Pin-like site-specific DNA recombinase
MKRAVAMIRVSQVKGREGEFFASPELQRERIEQVCQREGLQLVQIYDELDVSRGKPLDKRPGLSRAVAAIETGRAEVVAAALFDRLCRSLQTQAEVIERVEAAGGQVMAVDVGQITNGTAARRLNGTMHGAMAEYFRRQPREKSAEAVARAVARGVAPFPRPALGYRRVPDGPDKSKLQVVPEEAGITHQI